MSNKYAEYLAFARLASWLDFPVGILEKKESRIYTLAVKLPMGVIVRRIPVGYLHGHWYVLELSPEDKIVNYARADDIFLDLSRSTLKRTIEIHKKG